MFNNKSKNLESLSSEELEELKKQRSLNRVFGLLCVVAILLVVMLIYEIVILAK